MITTVLFDLDETLLDRETTLRRFIYAQYHKYSNRFGHIPFPIWEERFVKLDRNGYEERTVLYRLLLNEFAIREMTETELVNHFLSGIPYYSVPMKQMKDLLRMLVGMGLKVGIVTNGGDLVQRRKIDHLGIRSWVTTIVTSDAEKVEKPNPVIFQRGLERIGALPEQCIFVGDHPINDILGAQKVGMQTIWLRRGNPWESQAYRPDFTIDELREILPILEQIRKRTEDERHEIQGFAPECKN